MQILLEKWSLPLLIPIVIAGGPKTRGVRDFLQVVKGAMQAGAKGLCIGRNV